MKNKKSFKIKYKSMVKFQQGILFVVLATFFIGLGSVFLSQATKSTSPIIVITFAALLSSILYFVITRIFRIKTNIKKAIREYKRELLIITIFRASLGSLILAYGFSLTSAIRAVLMIRMEPIFVIILGYIFLREGLKPKEIFLVILMVFGGLLLSTSGNLSKLNQLPSIGDGLVVLAVLSFALTYIASRKLMQKIDAITANMIPNFFGGLILFLLILTLGVRLSITTYALYTTLAHTLLFYLLGLTLWFAALKTIEGWKVSSLLSLTPIFSGLFAYFWLGETLNQIQIIGAGIILAGSYMLAKK